KRAARSVEAADLLSLTELERRQEPDLLPRPEATLLAARPQAPSIRQERSVAPEASEVALPTLAPPVPSSASKRKRVWERPVVAETSPDDFEKWRSIGRSDADISRSVETLAPFGKKYVDQLATAYLAFNDKSYLPMIVKMVAATIKKDSGRDVGTAADGDHGMDLISFALSKTRNSTVDGLLDRAQFEVSAAKEPRAMDAEPAPAATAERPVASASPPCNPPK